MRLICYATSGAPPKIVPAPVERDWMDRTPDGHAYRCLPLNIANAHGWLILNAAPFTAEWNGSPDLKAVTVRPLKEGDPVLAESHFGAGVLTFHVRGLFRTEPGYDLMVTGPTNHIKDSIQPLTGVVETDWAPFTFTMNWKFTRPNTPIRFGRDEPFCMIYPVRRGLIDEVEPEIRPIESDAEINSAFTAWGESRRGFNQELRVPGSEARAKKWQKDYFRGETQYAESPPDHRTKLRPRPFAIIRQWRAGGLLDQLDHEPTDANRSGRDRMRDGVLIRGPDTLLITPDADFDLDALDFVCRPNFLSQSETTLLAEAARALTRSGPLPTDATGEDEIRDWVAMFRDIARRRPDVAALLRDIQHRVIERIGRFYDLTLPLFTDSTHLIRLIEGLWLEPHAARAHADGSPHLTEHRDFASIVFLNDDYSGGEVYFPRLDLVVQPRAGMLLAFTGGWHHEHGVTEVAGGDQLTMTAFHTFDSRMRDADLMTLDGQPVAS